MATASSAKNLTYTIKVTIAPPEDDPVGNTVERFGPADMAMARAIAKAEDAVRAYHAKELEDTDGEMRAIFSILHRRYKANGSMSSSSHIHPVDGSRSLDIKHCDTFVVPELSFRSGASKCHHLRWGAKRECTSGICYVLTHEKDCAAVGRKVASKLWEDEDEQKRLWLPERLSSTGRYIYYVGQHPEEGIENSMEE